MTRHLFVVARDQLGLFAFLCREFDGQKDVDVILDRRRGDRRLQLEPVGVERRAPGDRRRHVRATERLQRDGYVVVHFP